MSNEPTTPKPDTSDVGEPVEYAEWVGRVADALHETCLNEWRAIAAVDPKRQITQHLTDAHYGMAHDLVRRLGLAQATAQQAKRIAALEAALRAYVVAQGRMLDRWAEGDDEVKRGLYRLRYGPLGTPEADLQAEIEKATPTEKGASKP